MMIRLHHRDLFIDHLLGLHDVVRHLDVKGLSSERSLDSSSLSSGPSYKRCRSPTASVPSPTHDSRSITPNPVDLLPPRKRFRDSYSSKDSEEEHMEVDTADAEADADITASDVREDDEEFEVEASAADTREIVVDPLAIGDSFESSRGGIPDLKDTIYDIVHYMSELVASGEQASLVERIGSLRLEYLKVQAMLSIERDRVDILHWHMALSQEEFRQVRRDHDDTRRRLRRLESYVERHLEALAAHEATHADNALEAENQSQNDSDGDNGNGGNRNGLHEVSTTQLQGNKRSCRIDKMVPEEEDQVEKFIGGLPDNIQGNVIVAEPTRLQDVVRIANNLMDQKLKGYAVKNAENKRRLERGQVVNQRVLTCFDCGMQGHFRSDCPKLKDQNHGNKVGNKNGVGEARGKAYMLGGGNANPDSNVVKGTFLLNNHYASMIFDSSADGSFVSTTFSTLLDITPDTLDVSYAVELADGRISKINTILRGCTLGLLGH
ncbi:reverse transcriptase domain-containing protein [Tanacetum coccineum]